MKQRDIRVGAVLILCLVIPVGAILWAAVNEDWGYKDDFAFDNIELVYLGAGHNFQHEADLYWLNIGEWPSTEAFYYSPLFAAGMAGLDAAFSDAVIMLGICGLLLAAYLVGTHLWRHELQAVTGVAFTGAVPIFIYYTSESFWANVVPANMAVALYLLLVLAVWAARRQNSVVMAVTLALIVIAKPQFLVPALTAGVLAWNKRAFVGQTAVITAAILAGLTGLAVAFSSLAYIKDQFVDWVKFLSGVVDHYPFPGSDVFFTSNNSLAQQLHRVGAEELVPLVFVIQAVLLLDLGWHLLRALRQGASWQANPRRALAFVMWSYLLVGLLTHVFMDLIAGPAVYYFMVSTGLVTTRRMKVTLVALLTVFVVGILMSFGGVVPCYLIFTVITLPRIRRLAAAREAA